ncbi:polysaccharide pyruvyl transferase family protein [Nocardia flavorosea]|uniref:Polysaccharide pyruvyl transferase family protein n=1 Tax=Nocardia flavorosea TaxID=53429 RepID=A0A846YHV5_9NOCA|nr:polysaccharide pyruvyl transferase family protein [Nocardia flavorosea]NKY57244.1 polysaccharide pyruvyl transferase family protein [Nocardia flavorosea]
MDAPPLYYLAGPAGHPNYGDELITAGWLNYLAETAPEAEVWVDTHSPGPAQVLLGALHPRARFTDTLWRLCWEAPSDDPWQVASWVRRAVADPGLAPRWDRGIALLRRADVLHLLGGGYINRIWPRHIGLLAGAAAAARASGARCAATGLGLFPEPEGAAELVRATAAEFAIADVRDRASADLLGTTPGVDDAFLAQPKLRTSEDDPPEVMLCLQGDQVDIGIDALASAVLRILRAWQVPPERIGVVEAIPGADRKVFDLIEHQLPGARFYPFVDIWEHGLPATAGQTWLTTRFHMHLVAATAGATGVAIPISADFYATKHRSLIELGSGWTMLDDLDQVPRRPAGSGSDAAVAEAARRAKLTFARAVYAPTATAGDRAAGPP